MVDWIPFSSGPGGSKKSAKRRSWFTPGKQIETQLAIEHSEGEVEELTLTHFTKAPRIGFGTVRVEKSKIRNLLVKNPHDYEQVVVIEKFPHKKNFTVDQMQFVVAPKDEVMLQITWTPTEEGNCREMILFHVDGTYRLQAYVYGVVEPVPTQKKKKRKFWTKKPLQPQNTDILGQPKRNPKIMKPLIADPDTTSLESYASDSDNFPIYDSNKSSMKEIDCNVQVTPLGSSNENIRHLETKSSPLKSQPENKGLFQSPKRPTGLSQRSVFVSPQRGNTNKSIADRENTPTHAHKQFISPATLQTDTPESIKKLTRDTTQSPINNKPIRVDLSPVAKIHSKFHDTSMRSPPNQRRMSPLIRTPEKQVPYSEEGLHIALKNHSKALKETAMELDTPMREHQSSMRNSSELSSSNMDTPMRESLTKRQISSTMNTSIQHKLHISPNSFLEDSLNQSVQTINRQLLDDSLLNQSELTRNHQNFDDSVLSPDSLLHNNSDEPSDTLSPGSLLDSSIPHDVMVKQLENVKKALNASLNGASPAPKFGSPRRNIATPNGLGGRNSLRPGSNTPSSGRRLRTKTVTKEKHTVKPDNIAIPVVKDTQFQAKPSNPIPFIKDDKFQPIPDHPSPRRTTVTVCKGKPSTDNPTRESFILHPHVPNQAPVVGARHQLFQSIPANPSPRRETVILDKVKPMSPLKNQPHQKQTERFHSPKDALKNKHLFQEIPPQPSPRRETVVLDKAKPISPLPAAEQRLQRDALNSLFNAKKNLFQEIEQPSPRRETVVISKAKPTSPLVSPQKAIFNPVKDNKMFQDIPAHPSPRRETVVINKGKSIGAIASLMLPLSPASPKKFPPHRSRSGSPCTPLEQVNEDEESEPAEDRKKDAVDSPVIRGVSELVATPASLCGTPSNYTPNKKYFPPLQDIDFEFTPLKVQHKDTDHIKTEIDFAFTPQKEQLQKTDHVKTEIDFEFTPQKTQPKITENVQSRVDFEFTPMKPQAKRNENIEMNNDFEFTPEKIDEKHMTPEQEFEFTPEKSPTKVDLINEVANEEPESQQVDVNTLEKMHTLSKQPSTSKQLSSPERQLDNNFHGIGLTPTKYTPSKALDFDEFDADEDKENIKPATPIKIEQSPYEKQGDSENEDSNDNEDDESLGEDVKPEPELNSSTLSTLSTADTTYYSCTDGLERSLLSDVSSINDNDSIKSDDSEAHNEIDEMVEALEVANLNNMSVLGNQLQNEAVDIKDVYQSPIKSETTDFEYENNCTPIARDHEDPDTPKASPVASEHNTSLEATNELNKDAIEIGPTDVKPDITKQATPDKVLNNEAWTISPELNTVKKKPREIATETVTKSSRFRSRPPSNSITTEPRAIFSAKRTHSQSRSESETRRVQKPLKKLKSPEAKMAVKSKNSGTPDRPMTRTMQLRRNAAIKTRTGRSPPKARKSIGSKPSVKGLAKSRLVLTKKAKTALPKHPMPFASKNMYYDERWIEKQERGFIRWINFILTPPDDTVDANKPTNIDAGRLCVDILSGNPEFKLAPTKEDLSLRAYTARRKLNRLRKGAIKLFQSSNIVKVVHKVEIEIETKRLLVRKDRKIHADVGIKQTILELLLSYSPLWLRIGLETIYGEMLPVQNNSDVIGISRFIVTRLLSNPDIAAQYSHPTVPNLYKDGYDESLAQFILKKFILLVFFLDKAKSSRLIDHDPCLFCKDADLKASKDLLIHFSRDYLSGEGDITKHLSYLGLTVSHVQTPLAEFDYAVTKLAVDLKDGIRLTRMIELLTHNWELTKKMRCPAISRLQKIHNMEVVFKALRENNLDPETAEGGNVKLRDVVDGHCEKTLALLWRIIFRFQVSMVLNMTQLKDEIDFLSKDLKVKSALVKISKLEQVHEEEDTGPESDMMLHNKDLEMLMKWCQCVCAYYDIKIDNFSVSFSDGRALCYLVHHYHPSLLESQYIQHNTTQSLNDENDVANSSMDSNDSFSNWTRCLSPSKGGPEMYEKLLANEKSNFRLLNEKVSELGSVPMMIKSSEMSNTFPDEKIVITYITYLCARLLDIRQETRAARVIQNAWRRHQLNKQLEAYKAKTDAVVTIQRAVRVFLDRCRNQRHLIAIVTLQK
ncbi:unnamed protein product, partial [Owenia fusiformis]